MRRRCRGGKPVGFKLCVGHPWEFLAICKAMLETDIRPDFIVVDGKEGGTGAAPLEFSDHLGMPMRDGLVFVRNALVGAGLRDYIRLGVSGKIANAFDMACAMALGADWCNAARGFMFSLGCIQSLELPHRPLPDRRRDAGQDALARARRRGQDRTRAQFSPFDAARAGGIDGRGGARPSPGFSSRAFLAPRQRSRGHDLRRTLSDARSRAS